MALKMNLFLYSSVEKPHNGRIKTVNPNPKRGTGLADDAFAAVFLGVTMRESTFSRTAGDAHSKGRRTGVDKLMCRFMAYQNRQIMYGICVWDNQTHIHRLIYGICVWGKPHTRNMWLGINNIRNMCLRENQVRNMCLWKYYIWNVVFVGKSYTEIYVRK